MSNVLTLFQFRLFFAYCSVLLLEKYTEDIILQLKFLPNSYKSDNFVHLDVLLGTYEFVA